MSPACAFLLSQDWNLTRLSLNLCPHIPHAIAQFYLWTEQSVFKPLPILQSLLKSNFLSFPTSQHSCAHEGPIPSFSVSPFSQNPKETLASLVSWGCSSHRFHSSYSALQASLGSLVHYGLPETETLSAFYKSSLLLLSGDQRLQKCYLAIGVLGL